MTVFCSWSGGKESSMALQRALEEGIKVDYLLTMLPVEGSSVGHGLPLEFYEMQAESMGIEMIGEKTTWEVYEEKMSDLIKRMQPELGIFGDVYLERHREWVEEKAKEWGFEVFQPLWGEDPEELFEEYLDLRFEGMIVKVKPEEVSPKWLGERLDKDLLEYLNGKEICPIGENGEYHTATLNGPIFDRRIDIRLGERREYGESMVIEFEKFELI